MLLWQIFSGIGLLFLILEMFTPTMFFLNFAVAAFITALFSLIIGNVWFLILAFAVLSILMLAFLRPLLIKHTLKEQETGIAGKYIGKIAKVTEPVSESKGAISIYDERWEARLQKCGEEIPAGCEVKIIENDSLILYVERL